MTPTPNTAYSVGEFSLSGNTSDGGSAGCSSITGDAKCPAVLGGTVTLDEGDDITCTIANDDSPSGSLVETTLSWTLKDKANLADDLICSATDCPTHGMDKSLLTCEDDPPFWQSDPIPHLAPVAATRPADRGWRGM